MARSMTTAKSHSNDPGHREVFVMGYHLDEPGVLQAWDTETESGSFETQRKVCMADHAAGALEALMSQAPVANP